MALPEILKRKSRLEVNPNQLKPLIDKLLNDLGSGYLIEKYGIRHIEDHEGEWDNASLRRDGVLHVDVLSVILKRRMYYKVELIRDHFLHREDPPFLRVEEYSSVDESTDWFNATRIARFAEGTLMVTKCSRHSNGWSQWPAEESSTIDFLKAITNAKIDRKATERSFRLEKRKPADDYPSIVKWPKFE